MLRRLPLTWAAFIIIAAASVSRGQETLEVPPTPPPDASPAEDPPVSFMKDVAPILVQNCIACHNARKTESKYNMTTFALLAKGGQNGEDITLEPGDPDASYLVELIRSDGKPRMPYKQDPLPAEAIAVIERWVKQGAKYDGTSDGEDWIALLHKTTPVEIPENYSVAVPITAVAFTPDNAEILTSGYHELNAFKVADGSLARRIRGLSERIHDVAYSADGQWMATASGDPGQYGVAKLWKVGEGGTLEFVRDFTECPDSLFAIAFSPDGTKVATAGADRAIRLFESPSGNPIATIEDHADWIFDLAFSADGKRLASASRDKTSKVFDVEKKEALATFPGHAETVYAVGFTPDGKSILTGGADNRVRVWNPDEDAKQVQEIGGFGGAVFRLHVLPEGNQFVACGADKAVRVLDWSNASQVRALEGHKDWVYTVAVSPDAKTVASGSWDGEVRIWNLADGALQRTILAAPGLQPAPTLAAGQ